MGELNDSTSWPKTPEEATRQAMARAFDELWEGFMAQETREAKRATEEQHFYHQERTTMSDVEQRIEALERRVEMLEPAAYDHVKIVRAYYLPDSEVPQTTGEAAAAKNALEDDYLDNRRLDALVAPGDPWDDDGRVSLVVKTRAANGIRWDEFRAEVPDIFEHDEVEYTLVGIRVIR